MLPYGEASIAAQPLPHRCLKAAFTWDTALGARQWALTSGNHSKVEVFGWVYKVVFSSVLLL